MGSDTQKVNASAIAAIVIVGIAVVLGVDWTKAPFGFHPIVLVSGILVAIIVFLVGVLRAHTGTPCPSCRRPVRADFLLCPYCGTRLRPQP